VTTITSAPGTAPAIFRGIRQCEISEEETMSAVQGVDAVAEGMRSASATAGEIIVASRGDTAEKKAIAAGQTRVTVANRDSPASATGGRRTCIFAAGAAVRGADNKAITAPETAMA
jgi:hypothetical protein